MTSLVRKKNVFKYFLIDLAELSKCIDKRIAAIITDLKFSQIFAIGINGGPSGGLDCLCSLGEKYTCVHAEANALVKCHDVSTDKAMFCTMSPCVTCASLIINSNLRIKEFYYLTDYRDPRGLVILAKAGILHKQI